MLICFTVSLRTLFVLNTVYGFSNHQQHLFDLKMEPHLTPSPSWISTCLFGVSYCIQKEDCGLKLKVFGEVDALPYKRSYFVLLLLGQRSL